jgi:hypothetical protein
LDRRYEFAAGFVHRDLTGIDGTRKTGGATEPHSDFCVVNLGEPVGSKS